MRLLRRLAKDEGTTVVIVSHDQRLREVADRVLWLEDGELRRLEALVRDPVCDMLLDPAKAPARVARDGETVYFCSRGCQAQISRGGCRRLIAASAKDALLHRLTEAHADLRAVEALLAGDAACLELLARIAHARSRLDHVGANLVEAHSA